MATFFMFGKYTNEALKGMSAARTTKVQDLVKKYGGDIKSMYALLGAYDLVFLAEFPGVGQAMQASVALAKATGISFTTRPAVSVAEFDQLMAAV